ncbi:MAG: DUF167 domain-containing protein [Sphingorhabdus sp.]
MSPAQPPAETIAEAINALVDDRGILRLRVVPGAKVEKAAIENGALKIWLRAPPEDGKANAAVLRMLADLLDLPLGALKLVQGPTSRDKRVLIADNCRKTVHG